MKITIGKVLGKTTKLAIKGTKSLSKGIGNISTKLIKDEKIKENIQTTTENIVKKLDGKDDILADKVEKIVDDAVVKSGKITGNISKNAAIALNASSENVKKAEKIGEVVGKAVVGGGIGVVTTTALISTLAASGTVGASTITSGLATLGGGSIAAGGAGMLGGLATASAITTASVIAATNTEESDNKEVSDNKEENKEEN